MTATLESLEYLGNTMWRASASSTEGSPTYRWYYRGDLIREGSDSELEFRAYGSEVPDVEVFDDTTKPNQRKHPGRVVLHWYHPPDGDVQRFDVEKESSPGSGSWSVVSRIRQSGQGHYTWRSDWLDDVTTYSYRVRATDSTGTEATVASLSAQVVRRPTVERWTATRNSGGTMTLSEA